MGKVAELKAILAEQVTQTQLDKIEAAFDKLFAKIGMNVEFSKHFIDRINDMRNVPEISVDDIIDIFGSAYKKYGRKIAELGADAQAVLKDMETDINIPFVLVHNPKTQQLDMVSKTIMRKHNFHTPDKVLAV